MAQVKFVRGLAANLPSTRDLDTLYFCTDGALYLGNDLIAQVNTTNSTEVSNLISEALKNYYTKTEIDAFLTSYYTKTEVDKMHSDAETALQKYADDAVAVEKDRAEKAEAKVLEDAKTYTNEEIVGLEFALSEDGKTLELKNKAGTAVATLDTTDFVVDGMLSSVVADQANNKLTFTWNTDSGIEVTEIELSSIADIYTGSTNADEVNVTVSNTNVISATVGANVKADIAKGVDAQGRVATLEGKVDVDKVSTAIATATADMATNANVDKKLEDYTKTADLGDLATKDEADLNLNQYMKTADHETFVNENAVLQSGITATKVGEYDAVKSTVDANAAAWSAKQEALTTIQMAAVDSGITAELVVKIQDGVDAKSAIENSESGLAAAHTKAQKGIDDAASALEVANSKATLAEAKTAIQGGTTNTVKDCVDAINALNNGSMAQKDDINAITNNLADVVAQLTWGSFGA